MNSDKQERWEAVVDRAQEIINALICRKSTREALIEIAGSETVAEFLADVENGSTTGSRQESLATPRSCSAQAATITELAESKAQERFPNLETQLVTFGGAKAGGKLNPHWVATLMGYPPLWCEMGRRWVKEGARRINKKTLRRESKKCSTESIS